MFERIELALIGLAAVIDTVLVAALFERRNYRRAPTPLFGLAIGAWLWHAGILAGLLLVDRNSPWTAQLHLWTMFVMAAGLLLLPCALVHAAWRVSITGLEIGAPRRARYAVAYLPLAVVVPVASLLARDPTRDFGELTAPLALPYAAWLAAVNLFAAIAFMRFARRIEAQKIARQVRGLAFVLMAMIVVQTLLLVGAVEWRPDWRPQLMLAMAISPATLTLLFGYYVLRYNFLQLMVERTIVYGAIVAGLALLYEVAVRDLSEAVAQHLRVDFGVALLIAATGLIAAYQPVRRRVGEALRQLLGVSSSTLRQRAQTLAHELSNHTGHDPVEVLEWFTHRAADLLGARYAAGWLFEGDRVAACAGTRRTLTDDEAAALFVHWRATGTALWHDRQLPTGSEAPLAEAEAALAARIDHPPFAGLVVLGRLPRNREWSDEEIHAWNLLVQQLGATLHNGRLQAERLLAERRALEQEKLSTLGLLASSMAHEIKNPLSSIKAIAAVLAEELGAGHPHAEELRLILGEVDRLSRTTADLLAFARPARSGATTCDAAAALAGLAAVMKHLARERGVALELRCDEACRTPADENALREIGVNLLGNAIDAAGRGGRAWVALTRRGAWLEMEVGDTGPGLAPDVQDRLFEPFLTTKANGSGLGLYLVGRRVRELAGEIECRTVPGQGTTFLVRLPACETETNDASPAGSPSSPTPIVNLESIPT